MSRMTRHSPERQLAIALSTVLSVAACTTVPSANRALIVGQEASIEGSVLSVDTAPWAYDGNAVVTVATVSSGTIKVQLPARWNLCKAQPHTGVQELRPRDRVRAVGTVAADNSLVVCTQPAHLLHKLDQASPD